MSARARNIRVVRSSLAVLLRIAVLFALTILFMSSSSQGAVVTCDAHQAPACKSQASLNPTIRNTSAVKAVASRTPTPFF
jgi:hypothetical protein